MNEPKYKKYQEVVCIKDYFMRGGAIAYEEGKRYKITDIYTDLDPDRVGNTVDYVVPSLIAKDHVMPEEDLDVYFIRD
jgi:hypothetical protein